MKAKDFARAEELLMGAYQNYKDDPRGRRTACVHLGMMYRKTGRYEDAIRMLEMGMPFPAAFGELVMMYRSFAKTTKKSGDVAGRAEWCRRMFSVASIRATVMTLHKAGYSNGVDWERGAAWIEDIRRQCGSIYAYHFTGEQVAGDTLLTEADYKAMRETMSA